MKKKKIIILSIIVIFVIAFISSVFIIMDIIKEMKEDEAALTLKSNLITEFDSDVTVNDFIENLNGTLLSNEKVDTTKLGTTKITFDYTSQRNKKKTKSFEIEVVDTQKPLIYMSDSLTVKKGSNSDIINMVFAGDYCDSNPIKRIEGNYDLNTLGTYNLKFIVEDNSGNVAKKDFKLIVTDKVNTTYSTVQKKVDIDDVINNYKKANTEIGIDVSEWQKDIDWNKVKQSGVNNAIIRVGYQKGYDGDNVVDPYFEKNIKDATDAGIKVGIYFYTYAKTTEEGISQANWVCNQLKNYKIDLPIAFDWESWNSFSKCNMSFFDINNIASKFIEVLKNNGYEGMLYSSKNYLEKVWNTNKFSNVWLAHYTSKTDYSGDYSIWQMCNTGKINGINGDVDIDIFYK